jgi:hypothetical protein
MSPYRGKAGKGDFISWKAHMTDDKKPKSCEIWINDTNGAGAETLEEQTVWIPSNMST